MDFLFISRSARFLSVLSYPCLRGSYRFRPSGCRGIGRLVGYIVGRWRRRDLASRPSVSFFPSRSYQPGSKHTGTTSRHASTTRKQSTDGARQARQASTITTSSTTLSSNRPAPRLVLASRQASRSCSCRHIISPFRPVLIVSPPASPLVSDSGAVSLPSRRIASLTRVGEQGGWSAVSGSSSWIACHGNKGAGFRSRPLVSFLFRCGPFVSRSYRRCSG